MTDALHTIKVAALQLLQQSPLLQNNLQANTALQQLQQHCYPSAPYQPYNKRAGLVAQLQQLPAQFHCNLTGLARLLILQLIANFSLQHAPLALTKEISSNYQRSLQRIYQLWAAEPKVKLQAVDDRLLKDIGLLTSALLPCSERVVEPFSVIQRSLVYSDGLDQGWRFMRALVASRGNKPVCRLHIHLSEINGLTAAGWQLTCLQLAQLLLLNPQLKGIVGASWFYDPALCAISPHLAFIGKQLADMQASWFFSHAEGERSGAFSRSFTRQQAFANGKYLPKCYVVFIPRGRLLAWYKRQTV